MEDNHSVTKHQQIITFNTFQILNKPQPKRQSMSRRLSGQQSIEQMAKKMSFKFSFQKENHNQPQTKPKQNMHCFVLKNLVNMGENGLRQRYEKDPFLMRGLKYIQKSLKQNYPSQNERQKTYSLCEQEGKINYRSYRQQFYENQTKMFEKIVRRLNNNKDQVSQQKIELRRLNKYIKDC